MITNPRYRLLLNYIFRVIYAAAIYAYKGMKYFFRPLVHIHPRIYRFAVTLREAVKELIRPPEISPPVIFPESPVQEPAKEEKPLENICVPEAETSPRIPAWLMEEWRDIHAVEPQLFPEKWLIETIPTYHVSNSRIAEPYLELCSFYGDDVSHVFLVPWLVKGGADLVVINYVQSLTMQHLARHIAVISTLNVDSPWKERLPAQTRFIEFGKMYHWMSPEEQEKLLIRLLVQNAPKVIHNINSDLGYRVFVKYGKALQGMSKLYASSFCLDMTEEGRYAGYPIWYLPKCFDILEVLLSENHTHLEILEDIYAFDRKKMYVHYQPVASIPKQKQFDERYLNKETFDILWAGRLDRQKRPDILIRIAEKCKALPFRFHVYGSTVLDADVYTQQFEELENISYHGQFNGLPSIDANNYDVFLYTSQWDGMPNVLLEAVSLGLPVIASDVGGIRELIVHEKTGFLITPYTDADAYADCLQHIFENRFMVAEIVENACQLIAERHSWEVFNKNIKKIPHYCVF